MPSLHTWDVEPACKLEKKWLTLEVDLVMWSTEEGVDQDKLRIQAWLISQNFTLCLAARMLATELHFWNYDCHKSLASQSYTQFIGCLVTALLIGLASGAITDFFDRMYEYSSLYIQLDNCKLTINGITSDTGCFT